MLLLQENDHYVLWDDYQKIASTWIGQICLKDIESNSNFNQSQKSIYSIVEDNINYIEHVTTQKLLIKKKIYTFSLSMIN